MTSISFILTLASSTQNYPPASVLTLQWSSVASTLAMSGTADGTSFCSVTMGGTKCTRESKNQQIELRDCFWMISKCLVWIKTCIICRRLLFCIREGHIYARTRVRWDWAKSWRSLGHYYTAGTGMSCTYGAYEVRQTALCMIRLNRTEV